MKGSLTFFVLFFEIDELLPRLLQWYQGTNIANSKNNNKGFLYRNAGSQSNQGSGAQDKLRNFLMSRCQRISLDATSYDRFKAGAEGFQEFLKLSIVRLDADLEGFCEDNRYNLIKTMKELTKSVRPCFVSEEAFLPDLVLGSFTEFLNFLCVDNGKNYKTFNSTSGKSCRDKYSQANGVGETHDCFQSKLFGSVNSATGVIQKKELCEDITTAERCFSSALAKSCPDFPAFERLNKDFFEAVAKPCSASSAVMASGLMIAALYSATKFVF